MARIQFADGAWHTFTEEDVARFDKLRAGPPVDGAICWMWTGTSDHDGVGRFNVIDSDGRERGLRANRVALALLLGELQRIDGVEHTEACIASRCANPSHWRRVPGARKRRIESGERAAPRVDSSHAGTSTPRRRGALGKEAVRAALEATRGDVTRAAVQLNCARTHLRRLIGRFKLTADARELRRAARGFEGAGRPAGVGGTP